MKFGFLYSHPLIYDLLMSCLYRGRPQVRFHRVAQNIEDGQTVLDLCAGTDTLYRILRNRIKSYTAVDINPCFTRALAKKGIPAINADITSIDLPTADIVTMNLSLYHFREDLHHVIEKMLKAARNKVIILEPVKNISASENPVLRFIARHVTTVNGTVPTHHFSPDTFTKAMQEIPELLSLETLENKRDMLAVLKGTGGR